MPIDRRALRGGAIAGAVAAAAWALQQPLDKRLFRCRYDDVELLGRLLTGRQDGWRLPGLLLHVQNGALFGAVYAQLSPALPAPPAARGAVAALAEHVALWPLGRVSDRRHPARELLPPLTGNGRAFWQAAWRHTLFGVVLGVLEQRLNAPGPPAPASPPGFEEFVSSNGRGDLADAVAARRAA